MPNLFLKSIRHFLIGNNTKWLQKLKRKKKTTATKQRNLKYHFRDIWLLREGDFLSISLIIVAVHELISLAYPISLQKNI